MFNGDSLSDPVHTPLFNQRVKYPG